MKIEDLYQAIVECDNGLIDFNLGHIRSFQYQKKWYPLHAVANRASDIANSGGHLTPNQALVKLVDFGFWIRESNIHFTENRPVIMQCDEIKEESKKLIEILYHLSK